MPQTRLFDSGSEPGYFGIKRFDRKNNQRFHVHTFGNMIHSNFRFPECDYETFLRVVLDLTKNYQDLERGFRQMIFNVMANNRDDHVKNFAFMMNEDRDWTLTPAYDLTYSNGPGGEHSMSLVGEGLSPGRKEAVKLGEKTGISKSRMNDIIEQVATAIEKWPEYAQFAKVKEQTKGQIEKIINKNQSFFLVGSL
jgi:serine/threonine-protein kinase HipA